MARADAHHTTNLSSLIRDPFVRAAFEAAERDGQAPLSVTSRASRGDKDSIDHPPGAHDDVANVVTGIAHCAVNRHTVIITELRI